MTESGSSSAKVQLGHADHVPSGKTYPLSLMAQDVTDAANIGSLFRLADALGVRHLYLTGASVTPGNPKVRRAARSTQQYVSWSYHRDPLALADELKIRQALLVSLEITANSEDVRRVHLPARREIVLVVGAESKGVSQALLEASERVVHIPMLGANSSMNLAVATALAVYEITRQLTLGG